MRLERVDQQLIKGLNIESYIMLLILALHTYQFFSAFNILHHKVSIRHFLLLLIFIFF